MALSKQSYLLKIDELNEVEGVLQELFQKEIGNKFDIGKLLHYVKDKKLYHYKDADGTYTWAAWADEFMGSRTSAERYINLWFIFVSHYKFDIEKLEKVGATYLYEMIPLLKSGEEKSRQEVSDMLTRAEASPSLSEFKKGISQADYSMDELSEDGHDHIFEHRHYRYCTICEKSKNCKCEKVDE